MNYTIETFYRWCLMCIVMITAASTLMSQENEETSAKMKSMFMVNFAKYTAWPDAMGSDTFFFGVHADGMVLEYLTKACETKNYHSRPMRAVNVDDPSSLSGIHMLYAAQDSDQRLLDVAKESHTLLISNNADIEHSHINFIRPDEASLKYEINEKLIKETGLSTKQELSNLATKVVK